MSKNTESDEQSVVLEHSHERAEIHRRLGAPLRRSYLKDAIYGAIDGAVTTFAVVAGVSGAGLSPSVVIILGMANLVGDGFSMAASNFLGTRAENQHKDRLEAIERKHIALCPEGEREEIVQILQSQGYEGELLEATVDHITSDQENWIRTMMQFEYGVSGERTAAIPAALTTFFSFMIIGALPLLPFFWRWLANIDEAQTATGPFVISSLLTAAAFFLVGAIKSRFVEQHWFWSAMETLAVGLIAAGLAYLCGYWLGEITGA